MRIEKIFRRIITLSLSVIFIMSLAVPVIADTDAETGTDEGEMYYAEDYNNVEDFKESIIESIDDSDRYQYGISLLANANTSLVWSSGDKAYTNLLSNMRSSMKARKSSFSYVYHTSDKSVTKSQAQSFAKTAVTDAYMHTGDPEEGDYLYNAWTSSRITGTVSNTSSGSDITVSYEYTWRTTSSQESKVTSEVNKIIKSFGWVSWTSDYEKIYDIYTYICSNIGNDISGSYANRKTAYGALTDKRADCMGHSLLLYRMLLEAGIDCRCITGDSSGYHMWNIIKLGGYYYNADSTQDMNITLASMGRNLTLKYFLKSDSTFSKTHTRDTEYATSAFYKAYPMSTSDYKVSSATVKKASDGNWYYYNSSGSKDTSYTGFAANENGKWYCEKGKVTFKKQGILRDNTGALGEKGAWYYVIGSKVQTGYTGVSNFKNENGWWYIKEGKVDFSANTVAKNSNGWWYVTGGKVQFGFTGLANYKNTNGWWYIKSGKVDFNHSGVDKNKNGWWYTEGGKVRFDHNGVDKNSNGWWYIVGGKVQFNFTGLADYKNKYGWWYIKNGKVDFTYNGKATNKNGTWNVVNGKVKF